MNLLLTFAARSLSSLPVSEQPRVSFVRGRHDGPPLTPEPAASALHSRPGTRASTRDVMPARPPRIATPVPPSSARCVSQRVRTMEQPSPVTESLRTEPGPRPSPAPLQRGVSSPTVEAPKHSVPVMPWPPATMTNDASGTVSMDGGASLLRMDTGPTVTEP
ncbi:hypothetical protein [Myxococcus landrumensis]|uniref:Uncharacterized protein n=1 Tax=Myxococcus landrumensis TaxID=2813577 RepID=A0ABX7N3R4_9BACT|nr:hypothetical protein [Myxococcus landrumus]QSQ13074.1 hypothetical protein JY572_32735 [Myxococcus landrumus]